MVSDPLIPAKLQFFPFVTSPYQPLLSHFQSFLQDTIVSLMTTLLKKMVLAEVIESADKYVKLCNISLDNVSEFLG